MAHRPEEPNTIIYENIARQQNPKRRGSFNTHDEIFQTYRLGGHSRAKSEANIKMRKSHERKKSTSSRKTSKYKSIKPKSIKHLSNPKTMMKSVNTEYYTQGRV